MFGIFGIRILLDNFLVQFFGRIRIMQKFIIDKSSCIRSTHHACRVVGLFNHIRKPCKGAIRLGKLEQKEFRNHKLVLEERLHIGDRIFALKNFLVAVTHRNEVSQCVTAFTGLSTIFANRSCNITAVVIRHGKVVIQRLGLFIIAHVKVTARRRFCLGILSIDLIENHISIGIATSQKSRFTNAH